MDPETRQRVVTLRNIQGDLAVLFGDYRNGVRRLYPDVVLRRLSAEMRGEGATFAEMNRPVRRGWPWNGLPSQSNRQMVRLQAQTWKRFWRKRFLPKDLGDHIPIQLGAGRVRRLLRSKGINAQLVKVLGSGGQGMVSLWEIDTRRGLKRVVIKSTALEGAVLQREKETTLALKRARHLVQLLRFNGDIMVPKNDGSDETEDIERWNQADDSLEIMCIEYMKNGDMFGFIARAGSAGIPVPNIVLWKIFICLIRACVSMAYPPRHTRDANTGFDRWVEPPGTEDQDNLMPAGTEESQRLLAYNLVHFDLDPQNVMIGDFDNDEHAEVPIFKVGDFGLARTASDFRNHSSNSAWGTRLRGKTPYLLPEQFTKEWDYINTWPAREVPRPRIAGNYGWHSNIWHVGVCMHMLITQSAWPDPPKAVGRLNDHNAMAELFPTPFRVTDFDGNLVDPFYTYGIWLANPTTIESERPLDLSLTRILVRCLAAEPADRPSLRELLRWARWREAQPDWRGGQDIIRGWANEHISQPPLPSPRAPASLQTGLAAIGTDVIDRLTEAAGLLRIGGLATMADKAEQTGLRRAAPVEDLRQRFNDQEGIRPPPGVRQAPVGWMASMVQSRLAQLQNLLNIGRLPSTADQPPPRPLRRREGLDDLRAGFRQGSLRRREGVDDLRAGFLQDDGPQAQPPQRTGDQNNQAQSPPGILRRNRPGRDLRVRFADREGPPPGRGLRRRPRFNDLRGSYQADPEDDLAL